jgi:hypothetical protein
MMQLPKAMRSAGWICFGLMWIPFATLILSMLGMPGGSYDFAELPTAARYSMISGGILMVASLVLLLGSPLAAGAENRRLRRMGRPAGAKVLDLADTGTTINDNPVVRLRLQVDAQDEPPFEAEAERLVSRTDIPRYQPGATLSVMYNPQSHEVAVLDPKPKDDPA